MAVDRGSRKLNSVRMDVGRALRRLRGRLPQGELAGRIGVTQATISRWEAGDKQTGPPSLFQIIEIEDALGEPRGALLRGAGLVTEVSTLEDMILVDPALTTDARRMLLGAYRAALEESGERSSTTVRATKRSSRRK